MFLVQCCVAGNSLLLREDFYVNQLEQRNPRLLGRTVASPKGVGIHGLRGR